MNDDADVNDDAGPSMGASRVDRQVFDAMVANLRSRLAQILPLPEEGKIKRDDRVWIGVHEVIGAMRCPRSITMSSPYRESAVNLKRRVGLHAIAELEESAVGGGEPIDNVRAVRRIVGNAHDHLGPGVNDWFEGLPPGGRTQVVAAAATWVAGVLAALGDDVGTWRLQRPEVSFQWSDPTSRALIRARSDAMSSGNLRSPDLELLLIADRSRDDSRDRVEAHYLAFVVALYSDNIIESVVFCRPRSRALERITMTAEGLAEAAAFILAAVEALRLGLAASAAPGRHCAWCAVAPACDSASRYANVSQTPAGDRSNDSS